MEHDPEAQFGQVELLISRVEGRVKGWTNRLGRAGENGSICRILMGGLAYPARSPFLEAVFDPDSPQGKSVWFSINLDGRNDETVASNDLDPQPEAGFF